MNITKKIYCNTCRVATHHVLKTSHIRRVNTSELQHLEFIETVKLDEPIDFGDGDAVYVYQLWVCQGCDTATLQEICTVKQFVHEEGYQISWTFSYHPKRMQETWQRKFFIDLPINLDLIYREVVESFNSGSNILCSIGLRALLEGICVNKGIRDNISYGLEGKINKLSEYQHLPHHITQNLKSFKFIGDGGAHRLEGQEPEQLKLAIEVMEDLLNFLYALASKSQSLLEWIKDTKS
jgi:Domain of unknown function (DUF4145)